MRDVFETLDVYRAQHAGQRQFPLGVIVAVGPAGRRREQAERPDTGLTQDAHERRRGFHIFNLLERGDDKQIGERHKPAQTMQALFARIGLGDQRRSVDDYHIHVGDGVQVGNVGHRRVKVRDAVGFGRRSTHRLKVR